MRIFTGVELPEELGTQIVTLAGGIGGKFRLPRAAPHITLKGPQYIDNLDQILEVVLPVASSFAPFSVTLNALDFFNEAFFVIRAQSLEIKELHVQLAIALRKFNTPEILTYEFEKYSPHVTIANCESVNVEDKENAFKVASEALSLPRTFGVECFSLFMLDEATNHYTIAQVVPLGKTSPK